MSLLIPIIDTTYINSYAVYVRGVIKVLPNQGQHIVLYTGGGIYSRGEGYHTSPELPGRPEKKNSR